ncbi:MAG: arsenic resistance protein [Campylobacteraceae bacterium]
MEKLKNILENNQIIIYFFSVILGIFSAFVFTFEGDLTQIINLSLIFMIFVTFLQIPLQDIYKSLKNYRFLFALLVSNFVFIPILVFILLLFVQDVFYIKFAIAFVLLAPCIDYVVTFSHLAKANSKLLLSTTPVLLLAQMLLLPVYLKLFVGLSGEFSYEPFLEAFLMFIILPLFLAFLIQFFSKRVKLVKKCEDILLLFPVISTAFVLFVVMLFALSSISENFKSVLVAVPIFIAFSVSAPLVGFFVSKIFGLNVENKRAICFSSATRNSLVILPFAYAVNSEYAHIIALIFVTQTTIELIFELLYIKFIPRFVN